MKLNRVATTEKLRNQDYYHRILVRMIWSVMLCVLVGVISFYTIIFQQTKNEIQNANLFHLRVGMSSVESALTNVENDAFRLSYDRQVLNTLSHAVIAEDVDSFLETMQSLSIFAFNKDTVTRVALYSQAMDGVLDTDMGFQPLDQSVCAPEVGAIRAREAAGGWLIGGAEDGDPYIVYALRVPILTDKRSPGYLLVYVSVDKLRAMLPSRDSESEAECSLILGTDGSLLLETDNGFSTAGWLPVEQILKANGEGATISIRDPGGSDYSINVVRQGIGRTYASIISSKMIYREAFLKLGMALLVSLIPSLCGLLISLYNTRRIYDPVNALLRYCAEIGGKEVHPEDAGELESIRATLSTMQKDAEYLQSAVHSAQAIINKNHLSQLLLGHNSDLGREALTGETSLYGIPSGRKYAVMAVGIADLRQPLTQQVSLDIAQLMNEWLSTREGDLMGTVLRMPRHNVTVFYFDPARPDRDLQEQISLYANGLLHTLAEKPLSTVCSAGISEIVSDIDQLPGAYAQAISALEGSRREEESRSSVVFHNEWSTRPRALPASYPWATQAGILESIDRRDSEKAYADLDLFFEQVAEAHVPHFIEQAAFMLVSALLAVYDRKTGNAMALLDKSPF